MFFDKTDKFVEDFKRMIEMPDASVGLAAISVLYDAIAESDSCTLMGLEKEIYNLADAIHKECPDLPLHFDGAVRVFCCILSKASEAKRSDWKSSFIAHASDIVREAEKVLNLIPDVCSDFLQHGMTILTRGYDAIVAASLHLAAANGRRFHVVVAEGRPLDDGSKMALELMHPNINVTVIPDAAVGLWMKDVDAVLLGTDVVSEDGGILAPVGTYSMCVLASVHNKPVYVVCETFKFMRRFFLNAGDLEREQKKVDYKACGVEDECIKCDAKKYDFTPPRYVTLLLTEKGPIPPTAVTHELTKLFGIK